MCALQLFIAKTLSDDRAQLTWNKAETVSFSWIQLYLGVTIRGLLIKSMQTMLMYLTELKVANATFSR